MYDLIWNLGMIYLGIFIGRRFERKTQDLPSDETPFFDYSSKQVIFGGVPLIKKEDNTVVLFDTFKISIKKENKEDKENKDR